VVFILDLLWSAGVTRNYLKEIAWLTHQTFDRLVVW